MHVLVVERSWHIAKTMKYFLERLGLVVPAMASTTEDAEQLIAEQTFDLALVDTNLKDETQHEWMARLKQRGVRVIVLSGYPISQASVPNAAAILEKPFSKRELLAVLTKVCSR